MWCEDYYVLDVQGFCSSSGVFIAKEVAILSSDGQVAHFVFYPPNGITPDANLKCYTELYIHGIPWDSGCLPYNDLKHVVKDLLQWDHKLYCKGLEKTKFLENLLQRPVVNMEDLDVPKLTTLRDCKAKCLFHRRRDLNCALQNVYILRLWLKTRYGFKEFSKRHIE